MDFQRKPSMRAGMQALDAHRLRLAVDRLDHLPILAQLQLIHKPGMRLHVLAPHRDHAHARLGQDARLIRGAVVALVPEDPRPRLATPPSTRGAASGRATRRGGKRQRRECRAGPAKRRCGTPRPPSVSRRCPYAVIRTAYSCLDSFLVAPLASARMGAPYEGTFDAPIEWGRVKASHIFTSQKAVTRVE